MKHLTWDYRGYDDLNLGFSSKELQSDWNTTIITKFNQAIGDGFEKPYTIFISRKYLPILESIIVYDSKSSTIFNKKVIPIDLDTPKVYLTKPFILQFTQLEHDNYGSVTIKNF